jgi:hypothetical protein
VFAPEPPLVTLPPEPPAALEPPLAFDGDPETPMVAPELPPTLEKAPAAPPDPADGESSEDDEHAANATAKTSKTTTVVLIRTKTFGATGGLLS